MELKLVHTSTKDDLRLAGLLYTGEVKSTCAAIYIHGFTSDFFSFPFPLKIASDLSRSGVATVVAQTRGTGLHMEFLRTSMLESTYIGSYHEIIEEAYLDIDAWIEALQKQGYNEFVLVGHSYGTHKVVRYLYEGTYQASVKKLVLLGPFDKNAYVQKKSGDAWPQQVIEAEKKIADGKGKEIIPNTFDDYPMTMNTFHSWYKPGKLNEIWDFYRMDTYDFPVWKELSLPIQVITGTDDEAFDFPEFYSKEAVYEKMRELFSSGEVVVLTGSGHCFVGYEDEVAAKITTFVQSYSQQPQQ
ncbi:MAG: alpha/beta hydrolase [Candidatus Dojkabacteria bacterium]|nr:MAG: alpha/beta hydrolase [Candidatus Dojkabacteria bacterium]